MLGGCRSSRSEPAKPSSSASAAEPGANVPIDRISYAESASTYGRLRVPNGAGPFPVAVLVHGGCWVAEVNIDYFEPLEQALVRRGFAVWSLEYRRVGEPGGGYPNTYRDVGLGTDHLRTLAANRPLDLSRVIAVGHSAGGALALWLARRASLPKESALYVERPLPLAGVVGLAPAVDLENIAKTQACGPDVARMWEEPASERAARFAQMSVMTTPVVDTRTAVILGDLDTEWTPAGRRYVERARAAGAHVELTVVPGADHMAVADPRSPAWPALTRALDALLAPPAK